MPRPDSPDWYDVLDVPPTADDAAIKAAHRQRAREVHPDVNDAADAHQRMIAINRARDVLLDPTERAAFDRSRARARFMAGMRRGTPVTGSARPGKMHFSFATGDPLPDEALRPEPEPEQSDEPARWRWDPRGGFGQEDWYGFLGVHPWYTVEEMQAAVRALVGRTIKSSLAADEQGRRQAKLRMAWEVLGDRRKRFEYDRTRPPWQPRMGELQDWYAVLGTHRSASPEELGEAVTARSREIGDKLWNAELREREMKLREAWWVLRDAKRRAAYDAALTGPGAPSA
jgi:DnaJ-class molecular chaperone